MKQSLQSKLRRLGVVKGARKLKTPLKKPTVERAVRDYEPIQVGETTLDKLLPGGRVEENDLGAYFVFDTVYPLQHRHGVSEIGRILQSTPAHLKPYINSDLPDYFRDFLLIDTETTGLMGAGTIAFMIGVGFFEDNAFVVRQYFVRDFNEEPAMLADLDKLVQRFPNLISFNGRTFDIPLLQNRFLMNRMIDPFYELPHVDLLHPARRIWKRRLQSVSLGNLESKLLGIGRTHEDVPGFLIPTMYHDFIRSGDAREMLRVFYHNRLDIISMVTLALQLVDLIVAPDHCEHPLDLYSLGKWQYDLGLPTAEAYLRQAAGMEADIETWHLCLLEIGRILKKENRRAEAVPLWNQVAHTTTHNTEAHIELAKFYEWHEPDLAAARFWTDLALELIDPFDITRRDELKHRMNRLQRKLSRTAT